MEYLLQHGADVHAKDDGEYFVILKINVYLSVFTMIKFLPILACFSWLSVFVFGTCVLLYLKLRIVATY